MLQADLGQEARTPRSGVALLGVAVLAAIAILGFISQSFTAGRANESGSPAGKIQDRLHASLASDGGHEVTSCESGGKAYPSRRRRRSRGFWRYQPTAE